MARTITEARALPLIEKEDIRFITREALARPLCIRRPDGSIDRFLDIDGRVMKIVITSQGESKIPFQPFDGWRE